MAPLRSTVRLPTAIPKIILFLFLITSLTLAASDGTNIRQRKSEKDTRTHGIYVELLGASNMVGIAYDARLKLGSSFGYRVGASYAYGSNSSIFSGSSSIRGFSVPLEVNYLLGRRKSKLEIGLGLSIGIYNEKSSWWEVDSYTEHELSETKFGYYLFANIGYRYQGHRGFMFRTGLSPSFNFNDKHGLSKTPRFYPYISFGYAFK